MTKHLRIFQWRKIVFSTNNSGTSRCPHAKIIRINLGTYLTTFKKINSKWRVGLNINAKLLEENIGKSCYGSLLDEFLDIKPKTQL